MNFMKATLNGKQYNDNKLAVISTSLIIYRIWGKLWEVETFYTHTQMMKEGTTVQLKGGGWGVLMPCFPSGDKVG